jgi:hypothetical protein
VLYDTDAVIVVAPAFNNAVLVVTVLAFKASLNVAVTVDEVATPVAFDKGNTELIVGGVTSGPKPLVNTTSTQ